MNQELAQRLDEFRVGLEKWAPKEMATPRDDAIVYHYCSAAACLAMISSRSLWASDYLQLNDPTELRHGLNIIYRIIDTSPNKGDQVVDAFWRLFRDGTSKSMMEHFYLISSFSGLKDSLPLWMTYGDDGCGVAVGIQAHNINCEIQGVPEIISGLHLIQYDDEALEKQQKTVVEKAESVLIDKRVRNLLSSNPDSQQKFIVELVSRTSIESLWNCIQFKHPGYSFETEARITLVILSRAIVQSGHIKIRSRGRELIRYLELPLMSKEKGSCIREIVVGPSAGDHTERAIRTALDQQALDRVRLVRSKIPYRSLR